MKIDIKDIMFYGLWDEENNENPDDKIWYEKSSCQFFCADDLMEEYGYKNEDNIVASGWFIPVFQKSETELKKSFIKFLDDKSIEDELISIMANNEETYCIAFEMLVETNFYLQEKWNDFMKKELLCEAQKWCFDNDIAYFDDNDCDHAVKLSEIIGINGYSDEIIPDEVPHQAIFYYNKARCLLQEENEIFEDHCWSSKEQILSSGLYIEFPEIKLIDVKSNFVAKQSNVKYFGTDLSDDTFYSWLEECEMTDCWEAFEKNYLTDKAINWCVINNISYWFPSGKPDHIISTH